MDIIIFVFHHQEANQYQYIKGGKHVLVLFGVMTIKIHHMNKFDCKITEGANTNIFLQFQPYMFFPYSSHSFLFLCFFASFFPILLSLSFFVPLVIFQSLNVVIDLIYALLQVPQNEKVYSGARTGEGGQGRWEGGSGGSP